jgi:hypothetical protein
MPGCWPRDWIWRATPSAYPEHPLPPKDPYRQIIGSLGGLTSWANTPTEDRGKRTQPARDALDAKFLREADGDPIRAETVRKLYYKRLAFASAKARKKTDA